MKIWTVLVVIVLGLTIAAMVGGEGIGKMKPGVFLPSEGEGWKWDEKQTQYNSKTLFDYINGAAELFLAYGFQNLTVRRFEKPNHPPMTIELYEMASSEDAYGLFSFERIDEAAEIGQGSEFGGGLLRFWKGKYFVSIFAEGEGAGVESGVLTLGRITATLIPATGPEPRLVGLIPGKNLGLVEKSVHYLKSHVLLNQRFFIAHKNILNLNRKTEAVLAQYLREKKKTQLLLIQYPDVREAEEGYESFMKTYLPDAGGKDRLKTEERKWTFARRWNDFVLIVFEAPTETHAEALIKATEERLSGVR
jgi:hypothetical protein